MTGKIMASIRDNLETTCGVVWIESAHVLLDNGVKICIRPMRFDRTAVRRRMETMPVCHDTIADLNAKYIDRWLIEVYCGSKSKTLFAKADSLPCDASFRVYAPRDSKYIAQFRDRMSILIEKSIVAALEHRATRLAIAGAIMEMELNA